LVRHNRHPQKYGAGLGGNDGWISALPVHRRDFEFQRYAPPLAFIET